MKIIISFLCIALLSLLVACTPKTPLIILDSGHNPVGSPLGAGAVSVRGISEVVYNDTFVAELKTALEQANFTVKLTRTPNQTAELSERADFARRFDTPFYSLTRYRPIFISIHHDSTQLVNLQEILVDGKTVYQTTRPIAGSSFHISSQTRHYYGSLRLATVIAKSVHSTGRTINLDHANPDYEKSLPLINSELGIYHHDNLRVLRANSVPAVLIEIGVLVDKDDEALISKSSERAKLIKAIVEGIKTYYQE